MDTTSYDTYEQALADARDSAGRNDSRAAPGDYSEHHIFHGTETKPGTHGEDWVHVSSHTEDMDHQHIDPKTL